MLIVSGERDDHCLLMMYPAELNSCSCCDFFKD